MMAKNQKRIKSSSRTNLAKSSKEQELPLFQHYFDSKKSLTTKQIQEHCEISDTELNKCRIGGFLEFRDCVILHRSRNCWRIIRT